MGSCQSVDSGQKKPKKQIVVFLGSSSQFSVNKILLKEMIEASIFSDRLFKIIVPKLSQVPFFNSDLVKEHKIPQSVKALLKSVAKAHAVIFITPEYNGAVSATILNAYEWITEIPKSMGQKSNVMNQKPVAIMSCSYISQNQITDIKKITKSSNVKLFKESFHIDLKSDQMDFASRDLSPQVREKFHVWLERLSRSI